MNDAKDTETESAPDFAKLGAHPSLAAALTTRGYTTATPVQALVLGAADRDLIVSAQTGSGKTIAFGLVMATKLLGEKDKIVPSRQPRALVITPTRELAAQVQRELSWLYTEAGARVAAFTGGTDLRGDSRTISRGVDIAVGTPGRLVDLLERRSLDLSGVEMVVLDEADEMLDMGFREAIETILGGAPAERRTLLFSATLPPEIRSLAKKFQKDAMSIDARTANKPGASGHDDITYSAHLCRDSERIAALVNVLRMAEDSRTLVFCRTREAVGELHRELASRGFLAAAISGDRAQSERDRALETMRQGRVKVLVATNVAARGLDLPELNLVVHADLPENAEALTHRSGRTGRAGKKGRSLFLVQIGQRRKAERLFHAAKLKIVFTPPPTLDDVAHHEHEALREELMSAAADPIGDAAQRLTNELLSTCTAETLIGSLIDRALKERPAGEKITPVDLSSMKPQAGNYPVAMGPRSHSEEFTLFQVNLGANDQAAANWILPLVCKRGAITRREVGAIRIARDCTFFEVASRVAAEFIANAAERDPRAPKVIITAADEPLPNHSHGSPTKHPARMAPKREHEPGGWGGKPQGDRPASAAPAYGKPSSERPFSKPSTFAKPAASYRDKPRTVGGGYGEGAPRTVKPRPKPPAR